MYTHITQLPGRDPNAAVWGATISEPVSDATTSQAGGDGNGRLLRSGKAI